MKKIIIFICNGNIHRSVIAAESLRKILKEQKLDHRFLVDSYGLQGTQGTAVPKHTQLSQYPKEWKAAQPTLQKLDLDISNHTFQKVSETAVRDADVVIALDDKVYSEANNSLLRQFPQYAQKIHHFSELTVDNASIEDPAGSSSEVLHKEIIENIYSTLSEKYQNLLEWVKYQ
jgi:protein-tyrosine-phosphatase